MFDVNSFAICIRLALALLGCYAGWRLVLVPTFNDEFRQRLFELRRELFEFAGTESLPYNDPAYVEVRTMMNGMLRFGHEVTFVRMIWSLRPRDVSAEVKERYRLMFDELPEPARSLLTRIRSEIFTAALKRSIVTSLPALAIVTLAFVIVGISKMRRPWQLKSYVVSKFRREDVLYEVADRECELQAA